MLSANDVTDDSPCVGLVRGLRKRRRNTVDSGQWTVDSGQWTVDSGAPNLIYFGDMEMQSYSVLSPNGMQQAPAGSGSPQDKCMRCVRFKAIAEAQKELQYPEAG